MDNRLSAFKITADRIIRRSSDIAKDFFKDKKKLFGTGLAVLALISIYAGMSAGHMPDMPVVTSQGKVIDDPWQITVNDEPVMATKTKRQGEEVIKSLVSGYRNPASSVTNLSIKEDVKVEKMGMKHGEPEPDYPSVSEGVTKLKAGNGGKAYVSVVSNEVITSSEVIKYQKKVQKTSKLYKGKKKVKAKGSNGSKAVTSSVVKVNGQVVSSKVLSEKITKKPTDKVILTGTKEKQVKTETKTNGTDEAAMTASVSASRSANGRGFVDPLDTMRKTSGFGMRWGRMHEGMDFGAETGTNIYAAVGGTVSRTGPEGGYGNLVVVNHGNGMETYYGHCSKITIKSGAKVKAGDKIAEVGSTGRSTGPHLHFGVRINGSFVNPAKYL